MKKEIVLSQMETNQTAGVENLYKIIIDSNKYEIFFCTEGKSELIKTDTFYKINRKYYERLFSYSSYDDLEIAVMNEKKRGTGEFRSSINNIINKMKKVEKFINEYKESYRYDVLVALATEDSDIKNSLGDVILDIPLSSRIQVSYLPKILRMVKSNPTIDEIRAENITFRFIGGAMVEVNYVVPYNKDYDIVCTPLYFVEGIL